MVSRFRSAMMWLLLLALPLQGFAAATMLNCGPNHHRMWEASVVAQADSSDHAAHGEHHHQMDAADPDEMAAAGDHAGDGSSLHQLSKLSKFKCSACAACCSVAFLPTAVVDVPVVTPGQALALIPLISHVGFFTDGPDRPPRAFLA